MESVSRQIRLVKSAFSSSFSGRSTGAEAAPAQRPLVQNRTLTFLCLAGIAVGLYVIGSAQLAQHSTVGQIQVLISEDRSWAQQASQELREFGKSVRGGVARFLRLPRGLPPHMVGMLLCTLVAGVLLYCRE
jgi:hypothetical protein